MPLIPWKSKQRDEPNRELSPARGFRAEMDRLFDSFFRDAVNPGLPLASELAEWAPPLDVQENDKEIVVRAELPGIKADELELAIGGTNTLVISGEKKETQERREGGHVYQERRFGQFRREVSLPAPVDPDDVQADYKDGVLEVRLKKSQEALPRRITIKSS